MRLVTRIPAARGRVAAIRVNLIYDGDEESEGIDVTDVQLQPGSPSGVVPNPDDVQVRRGAKQYRNGIVAPSTDQIIILSNSDLASPTRVTVTPSGPAEVRIGSYRFGKISGPAYADAATGTATHGWGRPPVLTERADGHVAVTLDRPAHLTLEWADYF